MVVHKGQIGLSGNSKVLCVLHQSAHIYGMTCTLCDSNTCRAFITAKVKSRACVHEKKQGARRWESTGLGKLV